MTTIRETIYGAEDPWVGFDASKYSNRLETWCVEERQPVLARLILERRPRLMAEIGSWKGWSACLFARALQVAHEDGPRELVAVDTWLGSAEMLIQPQIPENPCFLDRLNGMPRVYWQFMAVVKSHGLDGIVTPFAQPSEGAAIFFAHKGVRFDAVYIDAAHDRQSVLRDLLAWGALLREGGLLFGDDYDPKSDPQVVQAVDEFVAKNGLRLAHEGRTWWIDNAGEQAKQNG